MIRVKRNSGFSLVELMVVVAIIGILAAVAIPNFTRFQRKARAAEGKDIMAGELNAEKGFLAEWEGYTDNLVLAGYRLEGQIRTNAGFGAPGGGLYPPTITSQALPSITTANTTCPQADTSETGLFCTGAAGACPTTHCTISPAITGGAWPAIANAVFVSGMGNNTQSGNANFVLGSGTDVGSGTADQWTMTDGKIVTQVADGVNVN